MDNIRKNSTSKPDPTPDPDPAPTEKEGADMVRNLDAMIYDRGYQDGYFEACYRIGVVMLLCTTGYMMLKTITNE